MRETLPAYLRRMFEGLNLANELRDWNYFAALQEMSFSAFANAVEQRIGTFAEHPRQLAIQLFARRAVELTGRAIQHGHQNPNEFLAMVTELEDAITNAPRLDPDKIEILEHNETDRRQWITPGCWLPSGHSLAILPHTK